MTRTRTLALVGALLAVAGTIFVLDSVVKTRREAQMVLDELRDLSVSSRPNDTFDSYPWEYGRNIQVQPRVHFSFLHL